VLLRGEQKRCREGIAAVRQKIEDSETACASLLKQHPGIDVHPSYLEIQRLIRNNRRALLRAVAEDAEIDLLMTKIEKHIAALEAP